MPAKSSRLVLEESNRVGVQFLLADLDTALTFLSVADVTHSEESRKRNHQNALSAYRTVMRLLPRVSPSPQEQTEMNGKLNILTARLASLGLLEDPGNVTHP